MFTAQKSLRMCFRGFLGDHNFFFQISFLWDGTPFEFSFFTLPDTTSGGI